MVASSLLSFRPRQRSRRQLRCVPLGAVAALALAASCSVDSEPLFARVDELGPSAGRPGNLPTFGRAGSGGLGATAASSDGVRGEAIQGLISADAGSIDAAGPSIDAGKPTIDGGAEVGTECELAVECEDDNECTLDECSAGFCVRTLRPVGTACGSTTQSECSQPDSCDGAGSCVVNHAPASTPCGRGTSGGCSADTCDGAGSCQAVDIAAGAPCGDDGGGCGAPVCDGAGLCEPRAEPNGSACPGGSCSVGVCVAGQPVGCPAVVVKEALQTSWSSGGRPNLITGSCVTGSGNTPDFALVFTAPSSGQYRIDASGTEDSVLVVRAGACSTGNEIACNDDVSDNNRNSRIQLELNAGQTITIYVSEFGTGNSGVGTVRIALL